MEANRDFSETEKDICRDLLDLPAEIVEHILLQKSIDAEDVINVLQTCGQLREICQSNELWRQKLRQRWPGLEERYDRKCKQNWLDEFKQRARYGQAVQSLVSGLSPKFYTHVEISKEGFRDFEALLAEHEHAGNFIIDELLGIVHDGKGGENLTMKYYAEKVLRFLQQKILSKNIQAFLELPAEKQHLERGATLIAQWCQPTENITLNEVSDHLDSLAWEVRLEVCKMYPDHPVKTASDDMQDVDCQQLSCQQCDQVLQAVNKVLFTTHKFSGNSQNYYNQSNSYLDKVLKTKTGIPITLCIVYLSVARRLGVICEPVNFPTHFLLRWKQHPELPEEQMYTYIDAFNGGKFLNESKLPTEFNVPRFCDPKVAENLEVLLRMIRNLISIGRQQGRVGDNLLCLRNALELSMVVCPDDFDLRLLLARVNIHLNINLQDAIDSLETITGQDQSRMALTAYWLATAQAQMQENQSKEDDQKIKSKTRRKSKDIKYSVGLIMKHKRYNYMCVVYGWDSKCTASEEWIVQMGVNNLPNRDKQPFYNVLVEDGSNRYAAEENLELPTVPHPINHPEIGKYFRSCVGTHYIPNAEKLQEYPDDVEHTNHLIDSVQNN